MSDVGPTTGNKRVSDASRTEDQVDNGAPPAKKAGLWDTEAVRIAPPLLADTAAPGAGKGGSPAIDQGTTGPVTADDVQHAADMVSDENDSAIPAIALALACAKAEIIVITANQNLIGTLGDIQKSQTDSQADKLEEAASDTRTGALAGGLLTLTASVVSAAWLSRGVSEPGEGNIDKLDSGEIRLGDEAELEEQPAAGGLAKQAEAAEAEEPAIEEPAAKRARVGAEDEDVLADEEMEPAGQKAGAAQRSAEEKPEVEEERAERRARKARAKGKEAARKSKEEVERDEARVNFKVEKEFLKEYETSLRRSNMMNIRSNQANMLSQGVNSLAQMLKAQFDADGESKRADAQRDAADATKTASQEQMVASFAQTFTGFANDMINTANGLHASDHDTRDRIVNA